MCWVSVRSLHYKFATCISCVSSSDRRPTHSWSCTSRRPCHPVKRRNIVHIHHCFAAGSFKSSPSYDQSVLILSLVASCLHCSLALHCLLCFCSQHGPLIVRIAQMFHHVKVSLNFASFSMFTTGAGNCLFLLLFLFLFLFSWSPFSSPTSAYFRQWSVGSTVIRIPILQICNVVVVLMQRLASFPHPQKFSL